ncbi:folate-binding protein YgfZ [Rhizobium sp. SG_E_25_P2]|uniref:CAF17-like 4Fe-4S cluster assembly/insertion protein YgfZ n=1 Tax=Rhizobium sp. SG_E_25_P2 TaxID=2879942 RepID=UPI0024730471|nr:folate-binding protein [Rhizobium sp. SG_E_25_P2]MDH6266866.1 folate-binding protein YgfZ [Rhizobium sp. SG_E_25_P2]
MPAVSLPDRAFITVTGEDAEDFLQSIVTTDIKALPAGECRPGALLTPQGKILFDFLIARAEDGLLLETSAQQVEAFIKRLTLYRLRAKAQFARLPANHALISWEPTGEGLTDHRFATAGVALSRRPGDEAAPESVDAYHALRLSLGVTGGGEDIGLGDYFPHDLMLDKNDGLSFKKGCYVGQEVVSRMQHRSTARRRVVTVTGQTPLADPGAPLSIGEREVGTLLSVSGSIGIAVARIDKLGAALSSGLTPSVGGQAVVVALPGWSGLDWPVEADDAQS